MMTPKEKYLNDPVYHNLVSLLESAIRRAELAPSEVREAAMYACIRYEESHLWCDYHFLPKKGEQN